MGTGEQVNRPASRWVKGVMRIGAVLVICLGIGLAVWDRNASAGIVIPTGILLYFMADIDRIEVFKLLGAEATMRKLDDKIDEAEAALSQIKEISEIMAEVSLTLLAKLGRWDAAPDRQMVYRLSNKIRAHLKVVGLEDEKIEPIFEPLYRTQMVDLSNPAFGEISTVITNIQAGIQRLFDAIPQPINTDDPRLADWQTQRDRLAGIAQRLKDARRSPMSEMADVLQQRADELFEFKPIEAGHLKATLPILLTRMRHFAETKKFLDLQHWFASDPARQ